MNQIKKNFHTSSRFFVSYNNRHIAKPGSKSTLFHLWSVKTQIGVLMKKESGAVSANRLLILTFLAFVLNLNLNVNLYLQQNIILILQI